MLLLILYKVFTMRRLTIPLLILMSLFFAPRLYAQLYAAGGFNGWNTLEPAEFRYADGVYSLEIDFSDNDKFKISTVKGQTGNGWSEFDAGTLSYSGEAAVNIWIPLKETPSSGNLTAPARKKMTVIVDLDAMMLKYQDDTAETPWSGTLPVMFINTADNAPVVDKETYLDATWYLDPMGVPGVEALGSASEPLATQIKGRGNYTWVGFDKKPYRLKFKEKQSPLGMPKSKHFVLLAHADDNSGFQRNECGFTISRLIGMPWTPESQPVELVLNGDYRGLYFLTQNIRVDKDRVNIVEQDDEATTDVDGGWLVEIDNYDSDPHVTVFEDGNQELPIWFTYKSPEVLSTEQESYLQEQMQAIDDAVYAQDKSAQNPALAALVDFNTLARYYITQELMDDCESFHGSCYLYRNRGAEQKWMFGPVWDFGNALQRGDSKKFIFQDPPFHQVWIGEIYQFDAFRKAVADVWSWWLGFGTEAVTAHALDFADKIEAAAACDLRRWPQYGNSDIVEKARAAAALIEAKTDWLKTQWGSTVGLTDIKPAAQDRTDVYNLQGVRLLSGATREQIQNLPAGMYITPAGKIAIK